MCFVLVQCVCSIFIPPMKINWVLGSGPGDLLERALSFMRLCLHAEQAYHRREASASFELLPLHWVQWKVNLPIPAATSTFGKFFLFHSRNFCLHIKYLKIPFSTLHPSCVFKSFKSDLLFSTAFFKLLEFFLIVWTGQTPGFLRPVEVSFNTEVQWDPICNRKSSKTWEGYVCLNVCVCLMSLFPSYPLHVSLYPSINGLWEVHRADLKFF